MDVPAPRVRVCGCACALCARAAPFTGHMRTLSAVVRRYDAPAALLADRETIFSKLVDELGPAGEVLRRSAERGAGKART